MDRGETVLKLSKFSRLVSQVGMTLADDDANIGPAIDSALRELGFDESELPAAQIDSDEVPAYLALVDYYVLDLLSYGVLQADIKIGENDKKRSQILPLILKQKAEALKEVKKYGYLAADFALGGISLNYLEPESV